MGLIHEQRCDVAFEDPAWTRLCPSSLSQTLQRVYKCFIRVSADRNDPLYPFSSFLAVNLVTTYFKRSRKLDVTLASNPTVNQEVLFKLLALGLLNILFIPPLSTLELVGELLQGDMLDF